MRPTRRSTLALVLGGAVVLGAALGGCDIDDLTSGEDGSAEPGSGETSTAAADPDRVLLDGVLSDLDARLAAVVAARARFRRLRDPLAGLEAMHLAHRGVLDPDGPTPSPSATPTTQPTPLPADGSARAAARAVRTGETAHQQALVDAAVEAQSGALARLLASMSASVVQHLAVLPADLAGDIGGRP